MSAASASRQPAASLVEEMVQGSRQFATPGALVAASSNIPTLSASLVRAAQIFEAHFASSDPLPAGLSKYPLVEKGIGRGYAMVRAVLDSSSPRESVVLDASQIVQLVLSYETERLDHYVPTVLEEARRAVARGASTHFRSSSQRKLSRRTIYRSIGCGAWLAIAEAALRREGSANA